MSYGSSVTDRLAAVRNAINGCLLAQDYTASGQRVQMARLMELRALEKELMAEAQFESDGGGMVSLGIQIPPSR